MPAKDELGNINLDNDELASIYDYLTGQISQSQLSKEIKKVRTNTYYYVGRAVHYWIRNGVLQFQGVKKPEDLGKGEKKKR